jgi:hypothetical protein
MHVALSILVISPFVGFFLARKLKDANAEMMGVDPASSEHQLHRS